MKPDSLHLVWADLLELAEVSVVVPELDMEPSDLALTIRSAGKVLGVRLWLVSNLVLQMACSLELTRPHENHQPVWSCPSVGTICMTMSVA